ncbi:M81 family metallopeptidase [Acuticoccus kandeliae]|uniref:M81 family metallopeptidase n=1 Tax=Acuticoccus kandeliae TaxID=2073160 RepID=UPI000D3E9291|nr:M81 family metallopeptidase [Acuticoccus kandeliae]
MTRVALFGLQHETNTFLPTLTGWDDFLTPGGWPKMSIGADVPAGLAGSRIASTGALAEAARAGVDIAPVFWAIALPSGTVEDAAFDRLVEIIVDGVAAAHAEAPLDGVFAELHGAMTTESHEDAEAEILSRLRARIGADIPIAVALDLHGNLSDAFFDHATLIEAYRTYPHVDMYQTGERAMARLLAHIGGTPAPAIRTRRPPFQVSLTFQATLAHPGATVIEAAEAMMAADPDLFIAQMFGFPLADIACAGPLMIAQHPDAATADAAAARMDALWRSLEGDFDGPLPDAAGAVAEAIALAAGPGAGPVVIADTQDNPGGGGPGDTTGLLEALIAGGAAGAVLVHIADPAAVEAAHAAGLGAVIDVAIGGRALPETGAPVPGPWTVSALADGPFTGVGPMYGGTVINLGPVALLTREGVSVIVAPRRMQASEPALIRHLGLEPADLPILAVKSSVHFRGAYQGMAKAILVACAPGPVTANLNDLPAVRQLRPPAGTRRPDTAAPDAAPATSSH